MKRLGMYASVLILSLFAVLTGCATAPTRDAGNQTARSDETAVDAVSGPTWLIPLTGVRDHDLQTYEVRQLMEEDGRGVAVTVEESGQEVDYTGVLLTDILAFIDGAGFEDPWLFDADRWSDGYEVTITAGDGYAATFLTTEMDPDAIVFAMTRDGEYTHPRLVGDAPRSVLVRDIATIEIVVESDEAEAQRAAFELVLVANGEEHAFSLADLTESPLFAVGMGRYTTAAGTEFVAEYGGVFLREFLEQFVYVTPETSVTFVAVDGYEMTYGGGQVLDETDGRWLLAFEADGNPLPIDPGYIRTIRIGPDQPNIPGHLSVKMIAEIRVDGRPFRDFSLRMEGPLDRDLDRSTLQSQMAFYGNTVTFTRRGDTTVYSGIPLYRLLAFADDPDYVPHGQDFTVDPYNREAAIAGYTIDLIATDGFTVTLDSRDVHENEEVIVALTKEGEELPENEWPLILVWDVNADPVPEGIRNVRNIETIRLNLPN